MGLHCYFFKECHPPVTFFSDLAHLSVMFSGIVEAKSQVLNARQRGAVVEIQVQRPIDFNDLKPGDSVAINGVCLTVESWSESQIQFALAAETLQVTGWTVEILNEAALNLERSLCLGDRIHGHLVSGHVDAMGTVRALNDDDKTRQLSVEFPSSLKSMIWKKGSITINGVSLTINRVEERLLYVGLIPETLERTNLGELQVEDFVTLEVDTMARGMVHYFKTREG